MKQTFLFLLLTFFCAAAADADAPAILWSQTYGGTSGEQCFAFDLTSDGGCVLAGYTQSFGLSAKQMWLVKTDANGDSVWSRMYGGDDWEECWFVKQVADGGYVLAGKTRSYGSGQLDYWLVKTDPDGNMVWNRTYGTDVLEDLRAAVQTSDGGYALAGFTYPYGSADKNFWLVKTNANGDSLWSRTYGGPGEDWCNGIEQTADGGFVLVGYSDSFSALYHDIWMVRTDANGDSLWSRTYGGDLDDYGQSIKRTPDGGFLLYGTTRSFGAGNLDLWLLKTNADGDTLWTRTFGADSNEACLSVELARGGGYVIAGYTRSLGMGLSDGWVIRLNADGDSLWSMVVGDAGYETFYYVRQTTDGGYLLAGNTSSFGAGSNDFYLVKTEPDPASIDDRLVLRPSSYCLSNYPNPFNPSTILVYDLPQPGHVSLRVLDVLGREVCSLEDGFAEVGTHRLTFDGSHLASGIYFARLDAGGFSQTKKLVLLK
jgi:uncharacterized delta-60 repeat protein